jgi:hypothetical protein
MTVTPPHASPAKEKPSTTGPGFRFGVAFRLLIAFAAITAFAIAVSAVALFTFGKYEKGFTRIASSNLPALVAASDLAQRSQALAANAPNLAVVDGHFARRAVSESLRNQLLAIAEASALVKKLAPATAGLESLIRNEALLKESLDKLDGLVADKLESDRVATNFMLRLGMLSSRVRAAGTDALPKIAVEPSSRTQIEALAAWTAAANQAIVVMLSTSNADTTVRLNRLRSDFADAGSGRRASICPPRSSKPSIHSSARSRNMAAALRISSTCALHSSPRLPPSAAPCWIPRKQRPSSSNRPTAWSATYKKTRARKAIISAA